MKKCEDINLNEEFEKALKGQKIWLSLKNGCNIGRTSGIVLFPTENDLLNAEAIKLLPFYKRHFCLEKIFVITNQISIMNRKNCRDDMSYVLIKENEMSKLLKYYCLISFWPHMAIVSIKEPFAESLLIKQKEIELKDYILSAIFRIR